MSLRRNKASLKKSEPALLTGGSQPSKVSLKPIGAMGNKIKKKCLFADDTEQKLQRMMDEFYSVCTRKKFKVNAGKSKMIVFERRK